ncbi:hypothetical protein [Nitratifractor sp.]
MRRVRILREPCAGERPYRVPPLAEEGSTERLRTALAFFRHECEDRCMEELLETTGLAGKRLTPARARRLILEAIRKEREG